MGHRGPSEGEPDGHFSMAEHADEHFEAMDDRRRLLEMVRNKNATTAWKNLTESQKMEYMRSAHPDTAEHVLYQNLLMRDGVTDEQRISASKSAYQHALSAKVGTKINCPGCNKEMVKKSYQHKFCGIKIPGNSNCKDFIHNWYNTSRLERI